MGTTALACSGFHVTGRNKSCVQTWQWLLTLHIGVRLFFLLHISLCASFALVWNNVYTSLPDGVALKGECFSLHSSTAPEMQLVFSTCWIKVWKGLSGTKSCESWQGEKCSEGREGNYIQDLRDIRILEAVWGSQQSFQLLMFSKKPNIYGYCLFDISVIHISIHFSLFSTRITARSNRPDRIAQ